MDVDSTLEVVRSFGGQPLEMIEKTLMMAGLVNFPRGDADQ